MRFDLNLYHLLSEIPSLDSNEKLVLYGIFFIKNERIKELWYIWIVLENSTTNALDHSTEKVSIGQQLSYKNTGTLGNTTGEYQSISSDTEVMIKHQQPKIKYITMGKKMNSKWSLSQGGQKCILKYTTVKKKKKPESRPLWYKCIIHVNDMYSTMLTINTHGWSVSYTWHNGVWSWGERGGIKGGNCKFLISCPFSTFKYDSDTEYLLKKLTGKIVKKNCIQKNSE